MNTGWITVWIPEKDRGAEDAHPVCGGDVHGPGGGFQDLYGRPLYRQPPLKYYEQGAEEAGEVIHPETAGAIETPAGNAGEKGEEETFRIYPQRDLKNKK